MISVCMATYNGAAYIQKQISTILSQLGQQDELIISDDGSSDATLQIIQNFNDPRIVLLHSGYKNVIKNFENALRKAQGDFIFLADQDDLWQPDKVKISIAALKNGACLVVSDCQLIDAYDKIIGDSFFALRKPQHGFLQNLYKNSYVGCCMAFDKRVLTKALPFPVAIPMHDSWIGSVASSIGPIEFINDKLVLYRRHPTSISSTGAASPASLQKQIKDRWQLASSLTLRRLGLA